MNAIPSIYRTARGEQLATQLAEHIVETEPFQNWDECINEIREKICSIGDKKLGAPVSTIVRAEDLQHILIKNKNSRYRVRIKEEI